MSNLGARHQSHDAIVIGGGPVGLAAALAMAQRGVRVLLLARRAPYSDNRTSALLQGSVDFLAGLGTWAPCEADATPLRKMRLIDNTGRLVRAPELTFSCEEAGLDAFGYNIENRLLVSALEARAADVDGLARCDDEADAVETGESLVSVTTRQGQLLTAPLVVGADGRHSICRAAAGIAVRQRALDQTALTFNISHTRPHRETSSEFHTAQGPCVFVPLSGMRSSVVWVARPDEAGRLHALDDDRLAEATERLMHSILGAVRIDSGRHLFPLAIERPQQFARHRIALVGEAAHVLPPIGAQGLNMGLRDAADIAEVISQALERGDDPGAPAVLARYDSARSADIRSRMVAIDLANRSLLSDLLPAQLARAAGMHMLSAFAPLRRLAMREGLAPSWRRVG